MRIYKVAMNVLLLSSIGVTLASCGLYRGIVAPQSTTPASLSQPEITQNDELIAIDLVNALVQFKDMHPANTQLTMPSSTTGFGAAMQAVLSAAGYVFESQPRSNAHLVTTYVAPGKQEPTGHHQTYLVAVGNVKIKRDYFMQSWGVTPSSNLYVQGADASQIILNDDLFDQAAPQVVADKSPPIAAPIAASSNQEILSNNIQSPTAAAGRVSAPIPAISVPTPAVVAPALTPSRDDLVQQARTDKKNLYDLRESNFSEVFEEFDDVRKITVTFPNDSMRLGQAGKASIDEFLSTFNSDTDVVSVVGCSHGRSSIEDGNKLLALSRADRVSDALLYSGIPEDKVLEEGCWAATPFDEVFPRRGVVLTIKREKRNG